ncbi:MAG: uroporphyrinogen decarboxylase family protein [Chloroflexota bacterium]|jgi:uroporphyrinogen decarboxylase
MTGRDRVLAALDGEAPDRLPVALAFYRLDGRSLAPAGAWRDDAVDVEFVAFPVSEEEEELRRRALPHEGDTRLGSPAQVARYATWGYHPEASRPVNPLERATSLADLEAFSFPRLSGPRVLDDLARQVEAIHARGLAAGGNTPHLGGEMFEAAWRLRGLENFLLDLVERKEMAGFLLDRLAELAAWNAATIARAGVDVLSLDDDVGMPGTMMIAPGTWREFLMPRLAAVIDAARAVRPDLRILYHSDGHVEPILDDLVELGVNAINPLQPEHMDAARIRRRFGPRLALWGTVGTQTAFAFGTAEDIRAEVRVRVRELGRAGLVLCPAYDIDEPDVPWANIRAFLEASRAA